MKIGKLLVGAALSAGTSMILVGCGANVAATKPLADARGWVPAVSPSASAAPSSEPSPLPATSVSEQLVPPVPTVRQVMRMTGNTKMPSYQDAAYAKHD